MVAAAVLLAVWGFTLWTTITLALLLVCPAIVVWAMLFAGRGETRDRLLDEDRRRNSWRGGKLSTPTYVDPVVMR